MKTSKTKLIMVLLTACMTIGMASTATAGEKRCYKVSHMKYHNLGGYTVDKLFIMMKNDQGKKLQTRVFPAFDITLNEKYDINIYNHTIPDMKEGMEVWAKVDIQSGDTNGCRKDGTKFYWYKDGGRVGYYSEGTTTLDNRCKIDYKPVHHEFTCPD